MLIFHINYGNFETRITDKKLVYHNRYFNEYSLKIILYTENKNCTYFLKMILLKINMLLKFKKKKKWYRCFFKAFPNYYFFCNTKLTAFARTFIINFISQLIRVNMTARLQWKYLWAIEHCR